MYTPVSPEKAVEIIRSGHHVYIHTAAAAPQKLVDAMVGKADELKNVSIYHLHTDCDASYTDEKYEGIFEINSLFIGGNVRKATWTGRANYIPAFLSEVPGLFRKGI
ncbi:MAG: 4-hydroxybutyrate CoA-transferase, partial [Bacteroidota bacterium]|nr:4-hydroxybutyrate CoA-transferase [Bacteroidota bacterium]